MLVFTGKYGTGCLYLNISKYFGEFLGKVESFFDKCHPFNIRGRGEVLSIPAFAGYLKMPLHVW